MGNYLSVYHVKQRYAFWARVGIPVQVSWSYSVANWPHPARSGIAGKTLAYQQYLLLQRPMFQSSYPGI